MARPDKPWLQLDLLDRMAVELWRREQKTPESASRLMRDLFREEDLRPKQQKRVKDLFYGMLTQDRMIDHALKAAAPGPIHGALQGGVRLLVSRVLMGDLAPKAAASMVEWIDWQRVVGMPEEVRSLPDPAERLQLLGSIPGWLAQRVHELMGDEADECLAALVGSAPVTLRANTLKCSREELAERLLEDGIETRPTRFASSGLQVVTPAQLFRTEAFRRGWFEMQDEASQLVAEVVAPPPKGLVVDACAGAGGKTLALAALLGNKGLVVAMDSHAGRLNDLRRRARRAGAHNLKIIQVPEDRWSEDVEELVRKADRVLIDAPCSGLGSLRRNPDMRRWLATDEVVRLKRIQLDLAQRTAALLSPRARMIYATCTFLPEENEEILAAVQQQHPLLQPVKVVEILGGACGRPVSDPTGTVLKTLPHRQGTDGFFAGCLRNQGDKGP